MMLIIMTTRLCFMVSLYHIMAYFGAFLSKCSLSLCYGGERMGYLVLLTQLLTTTLSAFLFLTASRMVKHMSLLAFPFALFYVMN